MNRKLSYPQRLGLILTAILALVAVIAIALIPAPKAAIPVYQAPEPARTDSVKTTVENKKPTPSPPSPPARSPLDEAF